MVLEWIRTRKASSDSIGFDRAQVLLRRMRMEWLMGPPGLIILVVILILVVGPKQLPKLGKQLGATMKSVRTGLDEMNAEIKSDDKSGEESAGTGTGTGVKAVSTAGAPVTCAHCHTVIKPGAKFCPECGAEVTHQD